MTSATTDELPQGDLRLVTDPIARALLDSRELAHLAYLAADGTPRVIPVGWLWTGAAVTFGTFAHSPKVRALRARPAVALTIDRPGPPPEQLTIRGTAAVAEVDGVPDEYLAVQEKFYGAEQARAVAEQLTAAGARMAVITVTPTWVGVFDFRRRLPGVLAANGPE